MGSLTIMTHEFHDDSGQLRVWLLDEELAREYLVELNASNCTAGVIQARDVDVEGSTYQIALSELGDVEQLEVEIWASRSRALELMFWDYVKDDSVSLSVTILAMTFWLFVGWGWRW